MNFTNEDFAAFERDLKYALSEVCRKYQVKLKGSKITYGPVDFDMKLTFERNEEGLNAEAINFSIHCLHYGFRPEDYMRSFEHLGVEYEFIGFDTSARKYNCIIRDMETGIKSRVESRVLKEMMRRDDARLAAQTQQDAKDKQENTEEPNF